MAILIFMVVAMVAAVPLQVTVAVDFYGCGNGGGGAVAGAGCGVVSAVWQRLRSLLQWSWLVMAIVVLFPL